MAATSTYKLEGSNSIVAGQPLDLGITITPVDGLPFSLSGAFKIENMMSISPGKWKQYTYEIFGLAANSKSLSSLVKVPVTGSSIISYVFRNKPATYQYLTLKIYAEKGNFDNDLTDNVTGGTITISFNNESPLQLEIKAQEKPFSIVSFTSDKSVVQESAIQASKWITFQWKISGACDDSYDILDEKRNSIFSAQPPKPTQLVEGKLHSYQYKGITPGDHDYTLNVSSKGGDVTLSKTIKIRLLEGGKNATVSSFDDVICNFCTSNDGSRIFCLTVSGDGYVAGIYYSDDGFDWEEVAYTNGSELQLKKLQQYINSPLVHLRNAGEELGRLLFVGGSLVPNVFLDTIAITSLDEKTVDFYKGPWQIPVAGHACVLFPHQGEDKIWSLGGLDKYGNALNDTYVSSDGQTWTPISPTPAWEPRCFMSATVEQNEVGQKVLWLGGGFAEDGGAIIPTIWKMNGDSTWEKLINKRDNKDFAIRGGNYISLALAFGGRNEKGSSGIYALSTYTDTETDETKPFSGTVTLPSNSDGYTTIKSLPALKEISMIDGRLISSYFKSKIWYLVMSYSGSRGIDRNSLYYYVPQIGDVNVPLI